MRLRYVPKGDTYPRALRLRIITLIQSVFPDWSDFDTASFGNLLIEMYAFVGDVLTFYLDNLAPTEVSPPTWISPTL